MTPLQVKEITSQVFGIEIENPKCRKRELCDCRKAGMLTMFLKCEPLVRYYHPDHGYRISTTSIGAIFSKDHATVINQIKAALDLLETDKEFRKKFELLTAFE